MRSIEGEKEVRKMEKGRRKGVEEQSGRIEEKKIVEEKGWERENARKAGRETHRERESKRKRGRKGVYALVYHPVNVMP